MILLGLSGIFYAVFILRTHFPSRKHGDHRSDDRIVDQLRINLKEVLSSRSAMRWLLYLLIFAFLEAPMNFETIWLREQVGMSQGLIGLYRAVELGVSMISLVALDRWLARSNYRRIVLMASFGLFLLYPLWLFAGGIIARFALAIPISFLVTVYWPIGKAQSLVSVPGKGGTVTAVQSLLGLIPLPLFFGMLAEIVTLTTAMFAIYLSGTLLMMVLVWRMPE